MTMATLLASPPPNPARTAPSGRGRRSVASIQRERDKHVMAAMLIYVKRLPVDVATDVLDCSRSTLYRWADMAMDYPEYAVARRAAR